MCDYSCEDVQRFSYLANKDKKSDPPAWPSGDSSGPLDNNSEAWALNPFAFDNDGVVDDNELHMWSNITNWEFLSIVTVHPTTPPTTIPNVPTMTIPNVTIISILTVLIELELDVHKDVVVVANMDDAKWWGNWMDMHEIQSPTSHIHPLPNDPPSYVSNTKSTTNGGYTA